MSFGINLNIILLGPQLSLVCIGQRNKIELPFLDITYILKTHIKKKISFIFLLKSGT